MCCHAAGWHQRFGGLAGRDSRGTHPHIARPPSHDHRTDPGSPQLLDGPGVTGALPVRVEHPFMTPLAVSAQRHAFGVVRPRGEPIHGHADVNNHASHDASRLGHLACLNARDTTLALANRAPLAKIRQPPVNTKSKQQAGSPLP
jgi:hypothetical protein